MLPGGDAVESSGEPARQRGHPRGQPDHQRAGGPGQTASISFTSFLQRIMKEVARKFASSHFARGVRHVRITYLEIFRNIYLVKHVRNTYLKLFRHICWVKDVRNAYLEILI